MKNKLMISIAFLSVVVGSSFAMNQNDRGGKKGGQRRKLEKPNLNDAFLANTQTGRVAGNTRVGENFLRQTVQYDLNTARLLEDGPTPEECISLFRDLRALQERGSEARVSTGVKAQMDELRDFLNTAHIGEESFSQE